mmetsp:Transcript_96860/g.312235  ORF Transcript_96860/g.312235 Transcript_96860/m.312235 type:complete len:226 (+) Transcript_96860:252-929(+)
MSSVFSKAWQMSERNFSVSMVTLSVVTFCKVAPAAPSSVMARIEDIQLLRDDELRGVLHEAAVRLLCLAHGNLIPLATIVHSTTCAPTALRTCLAECIISDAISKGPTVGSTSPQLQRDLLAALLTALRVAGLLLIHVVCCRNCVAFSRVEQRAAQLSNTSTQRFHCTSGFAIPTLRGTALHHSAHGRAQNVQQLVDEVAAGLHVDHITIRATQQFGLDRLCGHE